MWLQESIYDNSSQNVTAGAVMWLQEQDVAAGVKMSLQDTLLKRSFLKLCRTSRIVQIHGLLEPHHF